MSTTRGIRESLTLSIEAEKPLSKPVVWLVGTGGTIAGAGSSSYGAHYKAGSLDIKELIKNNPGLAQYDIRSTNLFNIDSSDVTVDHWLDLAQKINEGLNSDVEGVVITHGTDTLEETAYFLNLVIKSEKPVVLVGAMRAATATSPDGPMNLFNAFAVASSKQAAGKGVLVVMNDQILAARDLSKSHTTRVDAFSSMSGAIGFVHCGKVNIDHSVLSKHTVSTNFDLTDVVKLPNVKILLEHGGSDTDLLQAMINLKPDGIIIAGLGNGSIPAAHKPLLEEAKQQGIAIVVCSRVPNGNVILDDDCFYSSGMKNIAGGDLTPQKARILLMLALHRMQQKAALKYPDDEAKQTERLSMEVKTHKLEDKYFSSSPPRY